MVVVVGRVVVVEGARVVEGAEVVAGPVVLELPAVDPVEPLEFEVVDPGSEIRGADMLNFERFETLGWALPAGPAANARRMFSVTLRIRHLFDVFGVSMPLGQSVISVGSHWKVAAVNTPAPLSVVYQVVSA